MVQLYRRKGDDRLVNTTTLATQSAPSVAVLQGGGYVVVWTDDSRTGGDASEESIKGQRFDANGDKVGGEFLVNSATSNDQLDPSVAGLPSGRFVVTWTDPSGVGGDFDGTAIKGQLFEADGTRVGSEFRINTQTAGNQDDTVVTELEGGGFVVTWADSDEIGSSDSTPPAIKAQLFDAAGAKVGGEILVDLETQGFQGEPSVTGLPGGGFAIVWTDGLAFNDKLIRLQLFDSAGARIGGEQVVNAARNVVVNGPNIAVLESGFVVTWAQQDHSEGYASTDVIGQRFDLSGAKVGAEFVVNTGTAGAQSDPDAHALPGGGFIVTWMGHGDGLSVLNIFGQVFDAAGNKQGPAFVINTITEANQLWPEVEVLPSGDIVVVWHDISHSGDDPSGAVRAQILTVSTAPATDIALSGTRISETAREDVPLIVLKTAGALNSNPTYSIVSDSSGGAFGIAGDKLVVNDHSLLDFEITNQVQLRIRTTDENGVSYEETIQLAIADVPEAGYAPDGDEFLVNTTTQDNQTQPVIASLASGGYVAIWSQTPLGGGSPVGKAQIFDAAGNKVGGELPIRGEDAVGLPGGGFVTTWIEPGASANVSFIKAQVYDAAGNAVGAEITNKSSFSFLQVNPSVATLAPGGAMPSGGFVLTWNEPLDSDSSAVMAQLYQPNGQKVFFGPFQVNSYTGFEPEVAGLENGNYVVVWRTADGEIRGQMFTPLNERFGVDFEVSTLAGAIEPHVAALAGGGFVVTYMGSSVSDLSAQIFDANGVKVGSEIPIAELGISRPDSTDVVGLPWGGFVVSWSGHEDSDASTDDAGTRARVFDSTGEPLGPELAVNQAAFNEQTQSTMAVLASGEVIVGWADSSGLGGDHSGYGIKARLLQLVDPGNSGNDILTGDGGDNLLQGGAGDDQLFGLGGTDTLEGGAGDDVLDGGPGADTMRGGADDDIYYVDDAGDVVEENAGQGTDEVRTSLDGYSLLGTQIENLTATTNGPHDLRGSAGDNVVTGAAGNDLLRLNDGGNDSAFGGGGNDVLYFGGAFTGVDVADGGEGRDVMVLQGNYALTLSATNLVGIESISLQSGSRTTWGDVSNHFYDYALTTSDANVAAGQQLIVNGQTLRAGEDFSFDGSVETGGYFLVYGGHGVDTLKGGAGNDAFFFEGDRWGAGDSVDGGAGRDALIISAGNGLTHIEFGATSLTGIESISLNARYATDPTARPSYELVLNNGNVAPGATLIVNGSSLADPVQTVSIDGSAVRNGTLILFGGAGNDVVKGGFGGDTLQGGNGADILQGGEGVDLVTGGAGADTFRYAGPYDSTSQVPDQIQDFLSGTDKIDLTAIDADLLAPGDQAFHWIGSNAFTGGGAASAGELRAWLFNGSWFVEGDVDGNGSADLVIQLTTPAAPVVQGDFLL